ANDMHVGQRVPTTWYRARLRIRAHGAEPELDLNGVTLPGTPVLVAGSNGQIAWGFTNSNGNWFDVAPAQCPSGEDGPSSVERAVPLRVLPVDGRVPGAPSIGLEGGRGRLRDLQETGRAT